MKNYSFLLTLIAFVYACHIHADTQLFQGDQDHASNGFSAINVATSWEAVSAIDDQYASGVGDNQIFKVNLDLGTPAIDNGPYDRVIVLVRARAIDHDGDDKIQIKIGNSGGTKSSNDLTFTSSQWVDFEVTFIQNPSSSPWIYSDFATAFVEVETKDKHNKNLEVQIDHIQVVAVYSDTVGPNAINDLTVYKTSATEIYVFHTSPSDDTGAQVASYDFRYSSSPITEANFTSATPASTGSDKCGDLTPIYPGTYYGCRFTDLTIGNTYYMAAKSLDEDGNISPISNVVYASTIIELTDFTSPCAIADLSADHASGDRVLLSWTSPGNDCNYGKADSYQIKYSISPITNLTDFTSATDFTGSPGGIPLPDFPGAIQEASHQGFTNGNTYYFRMRTKDESNNWSELSNEVSVTINTGSDITAPGVISDLSVGVITDTTVKLSWTATGDDSDKLLANSYDLRYSTTPITNLMEFNAATTVNDMILPEPPGTYQSFTVTGLSASTLYYFAIRAKDEVPNMGPISNTVSFTTEANGIDVIDPDTISDLTVSAANEYSIELLWTAVGDNANEGAANTYDIRYSTSPINDLTDFNNANLYTTSLIPSTAGASDQIMILGLAANTTYYFGVVAFDEDGNPTTPTIAAGNTASGTTTNSPDSIAPDPILATNITEVSIGNSFINISWPAPGDDASTGRASAYDIRYHQANTTISQDEWDDATVIQVSTEGTPSLAGATDSFSLSGLSANTDYTLVIRAIDEVGNISSLPSGAASDDRNYTFTTTNNTPPATPVITTDGGNGVGVDYSTTDSLLILSGTCGSGTNSIQINNSTAGVTQNCPGTWSYNNLTANSPLNQGANNFEVIAYNITNDPSLSDSINVTFTPLSAANLSYTSSITFADTGVGQSNVQTLTIINNGTNNATSFTRSLLTGTNYNISSTTCGTSLSFLVSCTVDISFNPITDGVHADTFRSNYHNGTITVDSDKAISGTGLDLADHIDFTVEPSNSTANDEIAPVITILDAFGNTVTTGPDATAQITLSLATGTGAIAGTVSMNAVAGVADFTGKGVHIDLIGAKTITATKADTTGSGGTASMNDTSASFTIVHNSASTIDFTTEPANTDAGDEIAPVITILDAFGNTVTTGADATAQITLTLATGTGTIAGTVSMNAVAGVADFTGKGVNIDLIGAKTITATKADTTGSGGTASMNDTSASFTINFGTATSVNFTTGPSNTVAGEEIASVVKILDTFGNTVTTGIDSTALITLTLTSGTGSLLGTIASNAVAGIADFTGLGVNIDLIGAKNITATKSDTTGSGGTASMAAISASFNITHAIANKLTYINQPVNSLAGAEINPLIEIQDSFGNVVTTGSDATALTTLTLQSGTGTLAGTMAINAIAGVVDFTGQGVYIDLVGAKTITATKADTSGSGGTNSFNKTSSSFSITHGPASAVVIVNQPNDTNANTEIPISAKIIDAYGNTITSGVDSTTTINLTLLSGPGALAGNVSKNLTAGIVDFTGENVHLTASGINYQLTATKIDTTGTGGTISMNTNSNSFISNNVAPQINFIEPNGVGDSFSDPSTFTVTWTDQDNENDSFNISIYAKTVNTGNCDTNATLIMSGISGLADGASDSLTISASDIAPGAYFICAKLESAVNSDVHLFSANQITLNNTAPIISTSPNTNLNVLLPWTYDVNINDPNINTSITYSLMASPTGMSINPSNGIISWTPTIIQVGISNITVRASDNHGGSVDQNFALTVANSNDYDGDGISNADEIAYGLNPYDSSDATIDNDGDGISNAEEIGRGLNPNNRDTDNDGVDDQVESVFGFNPSSNGDIVKVIPGGTGGGGCSAFASPFDERPLSFWEKILNFFFNSTPGLLILFISFKKCFKRIRAFS